jgi:hypothetical protein
MPKLITLSPEVEQSLGFTHKVILDYTDVKALTSAAVYSIFPEKSAAGVWTVLAFASATSVPAGTIVKQCVGRVTTAFHSPNDTITLAVEVGDGGDIDRYLDAGNCKTLGYTPTPPLLMPYVYTTADTIDIIFTAGTEAITVLDAGVLEVYLELRDLSPLNRPTILANA